tara:strand:- start:30065 stop:30598 length:534 start_codon:yes stop_codon:yes gene_type:complete
MKKILFTALILSSALPLAAFAGHGHEGMQGMKSMHGNHNMEKMEQKSKMAMGTGVVHSISHMNRTVNLTHEPIPMLKWPAMTMDLAVSDDVKLKEIEINKEIKFHIQLGDDKIFRITKIMGSTSGEQYMMEGMHENMKGMHGNMKGMMNQCMDASCMSDHDDTDADAEKSNSSKHDH